MPAPLDGPHNPFLFVGGDAVVDVGIGPAAPRVVAPKLPPRAGRSPLENQAGEDGPVRLNISDYRQPPAGPHPRRGGEPGRGER